MGGVMMFYQALIVGLCVWLTVGGFELCGFSQLYQPIVVGPLVGFLLGDIQTGLKIGASLQAIFMGVVNIGGATSAEPGMATALSTSFAIILGGGLATALPLALPLAVIGLQIKNLEFVAIIGPFASLFDKFAEKGMENGIVFLHFGLWALQWFIYSLVPFFAVLLGANTVKTAIGLIPKVIMGGLTVAGNLLPAVGMAMLLKSLWNKNNAAFYFLGFVLSAYLNLPLIAVSVIAFVIAITIGIRDYQISKLQNKDNKEIMNASDNNENNSDEEEEEFLS